MSALAHELLTDQYGKSLYGQCGNCQRLVNNHDPMHRVSGILAGGRGVECVLRGDIEPHEAMPLGPKGVRS